MRLLVACSMLLHVAHVFSEPYVETCVDDDAKSQEVVGMDCAGLLSTVEGVCSLHVPIVAALISGGTVTAEVVLAAYESCKKTCVLCKPRGECIDEDAASATFLNNLIAKCSDIPPLNDGGCDKNGPTLSLAEGLGINQMSVDGYIQSCPRACGRCTVPPPCLDDEEREISMLEPLKKGWSCGEAVDDNGGHCSPEGTLFSAGGLLHGFDNVLFREICQKSCHICVSPNRCRNYDDKVKEITAPYGGLDCAAIIGLNGGDCSWSGSILSAIDVYGLNLLEQVVWNCPLACGVCYRNKVSCLDSSFGMRQAVPSIPSCSAGYEANGMTCEWGSQSKAVSTIDVTPKQLEDAFEQYCPSACGFCVEENIPTPAPTMSIEEVIYIVQSNMNPGSGGMYFLEPENVTCGGARVWRMNSTDYPLHYILSDADGHWILTNDPGVPEELEQAAVHENNTCSNLEPRTRSMEPHGIMAPFEVRWGQFVQLKWVYDESVRLQLGACTGERQCLQLNCQEPTDTSYACEDCSLSSAKLSCTHGGTPLRVVMVVVVIGVILLVTAGNLWVVKTKAASPPTPRASRRFSIPTTAVRAHNPCLVMLQRYRKAFLQYMGQLGNTVARYKGCFFFSVITILASFIPAGAPLFEIDTSETAWVPEGGRLEREINFVDDWTEKSKRPSAVFVMLGSDTGESALTAHHARMMLKVLIELRKVRVPLKHSNGSVALMVGWDDFCASIDHPLLDQIMPGGKPCINPSVLDCFFEGGWMLDDVSRGVPMPEGNQSVLYKNLLQAVAIAETAAPGAIKSYVGRPSIQNLTDEDFVEAYSQFATKCDHWTVGTTLSRSEAFGSFVAETEPLERLGNETRLISAQKLQAYVVQYSAKRTKEFKVHLQAFEERAIETAMSDWFDAISDKLEEMDDDDENYPHTSISVFMSVSIGRMFKEIGEAKLENFVIGWVIITVYVILTQWDKDRSESHAVVGIIGMFLVLLANVSGFCFISLIGIKHNHVTIQALPFMALGLGVDDMFLLLHYYKSVPDKMRPTPQVIADLFRLAGVSITLTSFCNTFAFFSGIVIPIPALRDLLASAGLIVIFNYLTMLLAFPSVLAWEVDRDRKALEKNPDDWVPTPCIKYGPQRIVEEYYSPFMQKLHVRIGITVFSLLMTLIFIITLSTSHPLTFGFELSDLTPYGSFLAKGFNDIEDHFRSQRTNHDMVTRRVDLTTQNGALVDTLGALKLSPWYSQDIDKANTWVQWLFTFADQLDKLNYKDPSAILPNITGTYINETDFYFMFHSWRNPTTGGLSAIAAQITDDFGFKWGIDSFLEGNTLMMTKTSYSLNMASLKEPQDWLDHTEDFHNLMEKHLGEGNAFPAPEGMYLQMEEFASLKEFFWLAFFLAAFVIFVCALLIPVSIKGAALISLTAITSTIEVASILMLLGLSFSSLVAVVLLMSMGISVEFSAHVIAGFETTPGDRPTRLHHAISHTFIPVCEGGVSSFLSFMLMGLSVYPYIVKYFFLVFLIVILIGLVHGLVFLPALVGLVGSSDQADEEAGPSRGSVFGHQIAIKPFKEEPEVPNPLNRPKEITEN